MLCIRQRPNCVTTCGSSAQADALIAATMATARNTSVSADLEELRPLQRLVDDGRHRQRDPTRPASPIVMSGTLPPPIRNVKMVTPLVPQPGHMFGHDREQAEDQAPRLPEAATKPAIAVSPVASV